MVTARKAELQGKTPVPVWLLSVASVFMFAALFLNVFLLSTESRIAVVRRIFWLQVPAALVCFGAVFAGGVASVLYLRTRDYRYDDFAVAANESVSVFAGVNVLAGLIWTKWARGFWWTWNAGMTSSVLLILIYVAYGILRSATPREHRAGISAVVCVFGVVDVPFIYLSNYLFRTHHARPIGGESDGLGTGGFLGLAAMSAAMLLLWWCLMELRRSSERLDRRVEALTRAIYALNVRRGG